MPAEPGPGHTGRGGGVSQGPPDLLPRACSRRAGPGHTAPSGLLPGLPDEPALDHRLRDCPVNCLTRRLPMLGPPSAVPFCQQAANHRLQGQANAGAAMWLHPAGGSGRTPWLGHLRQSLQPPGARLYSQRYRWQRACLRLALWSPCPPGSSQGIEEKQQLTGLSLGPVAIPGLSSLKCAAPTPATLLLIPLKCTSRCQWL